MKKLDRELGLFSVFCLSTGAMIGSGIFVLPGLAATIGGPLIFLGYALAGLLVLPAALSKAELATAMPESGGTYLFLDRSLGPLAGTLTGIGTWISLILKSSFALVGFSAYLMIFTDFSAGLAKYIAVVFALCLIGLNCWGVKLSGDVQASLVVVTLAILVLFVGRGAIDVEKAHFSNLLPHGSLGFLSSVAFIFVSYAGLTKIASTAEEIKDPDRNIPWGIMLSLITMILVYTAVCYVIVGVVPPDKLGHGANKLTPMAQAGYWLLGNWGEWLISGVALFALLSMANAGILSSSRYPLAMSRDNHLPSALKEINDTLGTPIRAILLTGGLLVAFILLLPVKELAKLASAFKLLVFCFVNVAVIVFRESEIEWYQPEFDYPFYPYVQIFGIFGSLGLFGLMGFYDLFPLMGALVLILASVVWYYVYAKERMDREGAFFRTTADADEVELFREARTRGRMSRESVIVPFFSLKNLDLIQVERRVRLAAAISESRYRLDVVDFVEVPEQSFLSDYQVEEEKFEELKERVTLLSNEIDNQIHVDQVVTHDARGALTNYAQEEKPHWVVFDWKEPSPWQILIGIQSWWLEDFPCDSFFFLDNGVPDFQDIVVVAEPGPYDGEILYAADKIANYFEGNVKFLNSYDPDDDEALDFVNTYQNELQTMVDCNSVKEVVPQNEWHETMTDVSKESDLILTGGEIEYSFFGSDTLISKSLVNELECNFARIRSNLRSPETVMSMGQDKDVDVREFLSDDGSLIRTQARDKEDLFRQIAETFDVQGSEKKHIENKLWDRERMQNTYIENGVAFPHALVEGVDRTIVRLFILEDGVRYTKSGDEASVLVVTVGPPEDRELHLQVLRKMAGIFVKEEAKEKLVSMDDYDKTMSILSNYL